MQLFDTRLLFTGDIEAQQEREILKKLTEQDVIDNGQSLDGPLILKVAHHGSRTSTTEDWLDFWKPNIAVISVGYNNLYGHPHADVVQRLQQLGSTIYRTDLHGEVQIEIRAEQVRIRSKLSEQ